MTEATSGSAALTAGNPDATATAAAPATTAPTATTPATTIVTTPTVTPAAVPAVDPWFTKAGIEDKETLDWLGAKNFPEQKSQIEAHRNLEKLLGAGERIALPKDADDKAGWDKVFTRLGRPEKAEGYGLDKIEGADPVFSKTMGDVFHGAGISASQAKALTEAYTKFGATAQEQALVQMETKSAAEMEGLKAEWGAAYDEKLEAGRRVVKADGLSAEDLTALESVWGSAKMMKYFAKRGGEVAEDSSPKGTLTPSLTMTPDAAKAAIANKMVDKDFLSKFTNENPKIRQPALDEMERLQKLANGEKP